jgi:diguanylate cyclase (GGDEF)-like protein
VSLVIPGGALLAVMGALLHGNVLPLATPPLADFYRYAVLIAGVLLAWRFVNSQALFALVVLGLAASGLLFADAQGTGETARHALGVLLPVNLAMLAFGRTGGFDIAASVGRATALFVQAVAVVAICRPEQGITLAWLEAAPLPEAVFSWTRLPQPILLVFGVALMLLLAKYLLHGRALDAALFWAVAASAVALRTGVGARLASVYLATGGLILLLALVETSYRMAFHDELTGLPGRRAFNQALLTLGERYAMAMVDVDHFKKFNDVFGHETGDQVLRMVAAQLARVGSGGQAFRCGGEEFALLFPGKSVREASAEAEAVRKLVARAVFVIRGPDRSQRNRPERRKGNVNRRVGHGGPTHVGVTISIGVAEPRGTMDVTHVIRAADHALYTAKENGRNRIEVAGWTRPVSNRAKPTPVA